MTQTQTDTSKLHGMKSKDPLDPVVHNVLLQNEITHLRTVNARLVKALEWALPVIEKLILFPPVAARIINQTENGELPKLSEARAALQAAT